jgi:hypothetical protein
MQNLHILCGIMIKYMVYCFHICNVTLQYKVICCLHGVKAGFIETLNYIL